MKCLAVTRHYWLSQLSMMTLLRLALLSDWLLYTPPSYWVKCIVRHTSVVTVLYSPLHPTTAFHPKHGLTQGQDEYEINISPHMINNCNFAHIFAHLHLVTCYRILGSSDSTFYFIRQQTGFRVLLSSFIINGFVQTPSMISTDWWKYFLKYDLLDWSVDTEMLMLENQANMSQRFLRKVAATRSHHIIIISLSNQFWRGKFVQCNHIWLDDTFCLMSVQL